MAAKTATWLGTATPIPHTLLPSGKLLPARPIGPPRCAQFRRSRVSRALPRGLESQKSQAVAADSTAEAALDCPRGPQWQVHKFGGTCVGGAELIEDACKLVLGELEESKVVMVVSAVGSSKSSPVKVTDLILRMIDKAVNQDVGFMLDLAALQEKHVDVARRLLGEGQDLNQFLGKLMDDVSNLKAMLQAISIGG